jgi:hypothetical protein
MRTLNVHTAGHEELDRRAAAQPPRFEVHEGWLAHCLTHKDGSPIANLANVMTALREDPEIRDAFAYDQLQCLSILRHPLPGGEAPDDFKPRAVTDTDVGKLLETPARRPSPHRAGCCAPGGRVAGGGTGFPPGSGLSERPHMGSHPARSDVAL